MASEPGAEFVKPSRASKRNDWLFALALLAVTLAAYYPAWFGKPLWDDDAHLTAPQISSWTGLWRIWAEPGVVPQYYPLVHSVFWLEYRLWGYAPLGYHLVNIVLHVCGALLLLRILRFLEVPGAWLAAAIFALHPIEVETVAWISELKNTLSGVFYFSAMLVYLRFDKDRERRLYSIALGLFFLGLLCKTVISTMPAALLVIFWWKRGTLSWKRDVLPLVPFFGLGIVMGLTTAYVEKKYIIGGEIAEFHYSALQRCLIAGRVFWFYIGKLLWPAKLIFIYPSWDVRPDAWWQYLFPVAALALAGVLWMLRKRTRAPLAAALFFGGSLFPALGFVNVYFYLYAFVADHFQYLAGIGIITLFAAGAAQLWEQLGGWAKITGYFLAVGLLALLARLTWLQCGNYADARTIFTKTLEQNPDCWLAWNNLGNDFLSRKQVDKAIAYYQTCLKIKPDYAKAENNLGEALLQKDGNIAEALPHFQKALAIRPDLPEANNNLAIILLKTGHVDEAIAHYKKALKVEPDYAPALNGLGNAYYQTGDLDDALTQYQQALASQSGFPQIYNNIGNILLQKGQPDQAMLDYEKALKIDPDYVQSLNGLAWLLATSDSSVRNGTKAVELAGRANRLSGGEDAGILGTLAAAYAEAGRFSEAVDTAEHALHIATTAHNTPLVDVQSAQLQLYRAGKPFHQSSQ